MSIPEKGIRSTANAHSLVENETQKHCYSEDASGSKPLQGEFEGKGENDERVAKASKVTGGRHVTSKNGLDVAKERRTHVLQAREKDQKSWDSNKKNGVPENTKRERS